ncbi:MAG: aminodeoxychorismate synthase component I [Microbacteriaceae bacterium]
MTDTVSVALDGWCDPAALFPLLIGQGDGAWLDSSSATIEGSAGRESATSYLAIPSGASRIASESPQGVSVRRVDGFGDSQNYSEGILDFLRRDLAKFAAAPRDISPAGFQLGWVGWLGYESGARQAGASVATSRYPDAALLFADRAVRFDHARRTVTALALVGDESDAWARQVQEAMGRAATDADRAQAEQAAAFTHQQLPDAAPMWRHDDAGYLQLIAQCQDAIARGDAYQLCLTNEARVPVMPDPLQAYLALRASSPTHHGGLIRIAGVCLLSASPEQFLSISRDGVVRTRPIKGTRPRGATPEQDRGFAAELQANLKERAENTMIVDLMRNDLGRVARVGSVTVPELLAVESYAQVHQLVSTVQATLAQGASGADAVAACFPAGSMTGAPKLSAMNILHGLEAGPRGIYGGCFGYFGLDGVIDLAMVIRSIVLADDGASIGAGGGITALSVPEEEVAEMHLKAEALLAAVNS